MKKLFIITLALVLVIGISGMVLAAGNDAVVNQDGSNQSAVVNQNGNDNDTDVNQYTNNGGTQTADVNQDGDNNVVTIDQEDSGGGNNGGNDAVASQTGDNNLIDQDTYAPGYNSGQDVTAIQDGDNNEIFQEIYTGHTESLYAEQIGFDNFADQYLDGGGHNHADIFQNGTGNEAYQDIVGSNNGYWGNGNLYNGHIDISQIGDGNEAAQTLDGFANSSLIWQYGDENVATGEATGNYNEIYILQGLESYSAEGTLNLADVLQVGNGNLAAIGQIGVSNTADVDQNGNDNVAVIGQLGDNNNSEVKQYNDTNVFVTIQYGDDNHVKGVDEVDCDLTFNVNKPAKQFNGADFFSYQQGDANEIGLRQGKNDTGMIIQVGESNQALLYQFGGSAHSANIVQTGDNNTAEVCQK